MSERAPASIAIIGVSARLPGAESLNAFWDILAEGRDVTTDVPRERWDRAAVFDADQSAAGKTYSTRGGFVEGIDEFDAAFFGVDPVEARKMDPQQRLALQEAWHALEDAGYSAERLRGGNVGVYVGARTGDYHDGILASAEALEPQTLMGHDTSILSARISHFLDLRGPNLTVNTACSSMGVALHLAVQSLRAGEVDMALVGGVHLMSTAQRFLMHSRSRLLSKSGQCRPFDEKADGFVLGEAAGFVVLKKRERALADRDWIYGNILATGVSHGGYHEKGLSAPNPVAQADLIRSVLKNAAVAPGTIGYVEAHGTGTYKGDAIEAQALREVYGNGAGGPVLGSVKANVGHALTAAVLPGLLKILAGFRHGQLARQANFETANELMRIGEGPFCIQTTTTAWRNDGESPRRAGLSAFSYTGTNFHMVVEEQVRAEVSRTEEAACVMVVSAKTRTALQAQVARIEAWMTRHRDTVRLEDVAYTLATGRVHFGCRVAFVIEGVDDCLRQMREFSAGVEKHERGSGPLGELAARFEQGEDVDLTAGLGATARRLPMPGYAFEKTRYWLSDAAAKTVEGKADVTLFLSRRDDVYQAFVKASAGVSGEVIQVKCGDGGFRVLGPRIYQVDPRAAADYARLMEALGPLDGKRVRVIHLWNYECEALDFVYHGNIDRCLHLVGRALDTGARAWTLLRAALANAGGFTSVEMLHGYYGVQPQNALVAGWLADECDGDARMRFECLRWPDRKTAPGEVAARLLEAGRHVLNRARDGERFVCEAGRVYLIDVGDEPEGLRLVGAWARRGAGKLVVLANVERKSLAPGALWITTPLRGRDGLKRLRVELERAGIGEIHGVVRVVKASDRENVDRNVDTTLLLDELTKEARLEFFVLLETGKAAGDGRAVRFADGFVELRRDLAARGLRAGKSACRAWLAETAFETVFEVRGGGGEARTMREPVFEARGSAELEKQFLRMVRDTLRSERDGIGLGSSLESLDFNSMRIVEFVERIRTAFETELRPSLFYKHKTLKGVFEEWAKLMPSMPSRATDDGARREVVRADSRGLEPIAIVGMSGRFPMADDLEAFWANLRDGRDCVSTMPSERGERSEDSTPRWGGFIGDIDKFDPQFFGISAREAELMDPQQRVFLECVWRAIEDAGHDPATLAGTATGVFVGVATSDYAAVLDAAGKGRQAHSPIGLFHSILANRVSYLLDLRGPSQPIDTACSSSLVAVHRAIQAIRSGQCVQAIVGGVNALLTTPLFEAFREAGMLAKDGRCKTFDAGADGYVRGEGVGALLLKPLSRARADGDSIYAVIRGSAENHGGHASSLTAPSPEAQADVLMKAYREAEIDPRTVGYLETHGTGTALGDPIEVDGLKQAFAKMVAEEGRDGGVGYCGIGSVKTQIGHLEAAAGITGLIKIVLAMRHRALPGNLHLKALNPYVKLAGSPFYVVEKTRAWDALTDAQGNVVPRRAGVSSFGFGGVNAHVVLEEHVDDGCMEMAYSRSDYVIVLSAKNEERLKERAAQLLTFIEARGDAGAMTLENLAYTLQVGRSAMEERLGFVVDSIEGLEGVLRGFLEGRETAGVRRGRVKAGDETLALFAEDDALRDAVGKWTRDGKWERLLELWVKGLQVDWRAAYGNGRPRRLHLPAYPFARERYWAEPIVARSVAREIAETTTRPMGVFKKDWEAAPVKGTMRVDGKVLILADAATRALAEALRGRLVDAEILETESTVEQLRNGSKTYVACVDLAGGDAGSAWLLGVQALVENAGERGLVLLGVTQGLEAFGTKRSSGRGALRAGLYRMLQSEYPAVRSRHVDVEAGADLATAEQVLAELRADDDEAAVCYRDGQRYRPVLQAVDGVSANDGAIAFPRDHVLWITGGTRGLGALCADHFVRNAGVRKIVLMGKDALPERDAWAACEREGGVIAEKIHAIRALEAQGAEVRVWAVDLGDAEALRRCVDETRRELGPIGGLIHCAGRVGGENPAFIRKTAHEVAAVLAPKVAGTDNLLRVLRGEPLAFAVLFSSVSAAVPRLAAGVSDYAMANAYLDYTAQANDAAFPVISIQWPSWKETGMGEVKNAAYASGGFLSHTNGEGLRLLDRVLGAKIGPVVMPAVYEPERWVPNELLRHRAGKARGSSSDGVRAWLTGLFADELRMEPAKLDATVRIQDYGLDSILLAQVWKRINRTLGTRLDPSAAFEYPTIESLAEWLVRTQADALARVLSVTAEVPEKRESGKAVARPAASPAGGWVNADIAVVGMACRFPGARDLAAYWSLLSEGRTAIGRVPDARWSNREGFVAGMLEEVDAFDPEYFLLSAEDARAMDPQALLVLEEAVNTLHHAGYSTAQIKGSALGVYLGARARQGADVASLHEARNPILAVGQNYLAANISRFLDVSGPSMVVDTACSSALVAMNLAIQALRSGEITAAMVGGANVLVDDATHRLFQQRKLLNTGSAFHLFDQRASGVVLGEGVGMLLLKTVEQAVADGDRIHAVVKGLAVNNDGRTAGPASPNPHAQKAVMQMALARSGLRADEIGYVEANGSGSEITDLLELKAIEATYGAARTTPVLLGSVKPNIGHPLCAEGIASFIKAVLMVERGRLVPFLSGQEPMTHYDMGASALAFCRGAGTWENGPRRAAINCFADGGTNAHVILEAWGGGARVEGRSSLPAPVLNRRRLSAKKNPWLAPLTAEHPLIKHHTAQGQALLPGLAYFDVLYQLVGDTTRTLAEIEWGNLTIHHPLAIRAGEAVKLNVECETREDGVARVHVTGGGTRYVTSEMRHGAAVRFGETLDLEALRAGGTKTISLQEAYAHFRSKGLVHTGGMQADGVIYETAKARVIEVRLNAEARADGAEYVFHPTLIDAAAVGAGSMFDALIAGEDRLFLPLYFGAFRATQPMRERCFARVKKSSLRRKNELLYSDMEFFDERGVKIAELTDFAYKLVRETGALERRAQTNERVAAATMEVTAAHVETGAAARLLQAVIAAKLKQPAESVDLRRGYYELGLESAMLLDVVAALEKRLSLSLSPTLLFEHATPAELATYLETTYTTELERMPVDREEDGAASVRWTVRDFPLRGTSGAHGNTEALVAELLQERLALWVDGRVLKARGESGRFTTAVVEKLEGNREAIAAFLGAQTLLPLSRSQKRYWVLSALQPEKSAYNNPIGMRLRGEVDVERIREAFLVLMNGHHVLRSRCPRLGKSPVMEIAPALAVAPCEEIRLTERTAEAKERALAELAAEESRRPINPAVGPNVRVRIVDVAAGDVAILLTAHHTVFDGYSYLPVMSEFMRIYRALGDGRVPDMTTGIVQYEDYTLREKARGDRKSAEFWTAHLSGAPACVALPLDRERADVNAGHGDVRTIWIALETYRGMKEAVEARRVTLFAFMVSMLKATLAAWSKQTDLVLGTTVQCRVDERDEHVIGDFTNFIPIRTRVDSAGSFGQLVDEVYRTSLRCLQHKLFPFDEIVPMAERAPRNVNPVYNILVNQLPSITEMETRLSDETVRVEVSNHRLLNKSAMLDLRFEWYEENGGLTLICEYNTDLFLSGTIETLLGKIEGCLNDRAYAGDGPVREMISFAGATTAQRSAVGEPRVVSKDGVNAAAGETEAFVMKKLGELREIPDIEQRKDVNFFELGLGSFDMANLSAELEGVYPDFGVGDLFKYPTIRALSAFLAKAETAPARREERPACPINFDLFRN